jgi:Na+/proline symporter
MNPIDWAIVAAYLVYVTWDGIRMSKRNTGLEGYLLAGRSLPWWAVGLSVIATQMSAITLVGTTGQAYTDGMRFIQFYFGLPLAMIILCLTVVPFFYRAKIYTAYEYLERRFDARTRRLASFIFLVSRGLSVGVIVAAPSVILSIVLGWSPLATILAMGLSTTIYTMVGGVQAVTWTDVKQMALVVVGLGGVLWVVIAGFPSDVGFTDALSIAGAAGRLKTIDFSFHPNETYTFWSGLIGGLFLMLSYFGCDQSQVQRYLTARSLSEGRISLLMSAFVKIPMQFVILLIGVLVFVFYQFVQPPLIFNRAEVDKISTGKMAPEYRGLLSRYDTVFSERRLAAVDLARAHAEGREEGSNLARYRTADSSFKAIRAEGSKLIERSNNGEAFNDVNYIFPTFITQQLPIGIVGLMIAAIFAAAMSSISAELNSLATTTVIDFYARYYRKEASDQHYLRVAKYATAFWGVVACVVALYASRLGSLIEVVNKFGSFFYGSLLGVFVLAIATKRATGRGAFYGLIGGMASVALVANAATVLRWIDGVTGSSLLPTDPSILNISFLWYNVIGCGMAVLVGLALSVGDVAGRKQATTVQPPTS